MKRFTAFLTAFILTYSIAHAQQAAYRVDFDILFDNLENSVPYTPSRTKFSVRLAPEIGLQFSKYHRVMIGADLLQDLGDSTFLTKADYTVYYKFSNHNINVVAGSFPRSYSVGRYPLSFFRENYDFYNGNIKGFMFNRKTAKGYVEVFCDWYGANEELAIDEFMLVGSTEYGFFNHMWLVGGNFLLNHYKNKYYLEDSYLLERLQYNVYTGVDFHHLAPAFEELRLSGGLLSTMERKRTEATSATWDHELGYQVDVSARYKGFGLSNSFYWGKPQFEYFEQYGTKVYPGSIFYTSSFYDRLEASYKYKYKFLTVEGLLVFHFMDNQIANQQMIRLSINFDNLIGRSRHKTSSTCQDRTGSH